MEEELTRFAGAASRMSSMDLVKVIQTLQRVHV